MQFSIVNLNEVKENDFRIDAEYYLNRSIKNNKIEYMSIYNIAKVSDGDHSKFPENQKQEIRYLQAKDIKNNSIISENPVFISREYFLKQKRSHIEEENILISIMGSVGDIAITPVGFEKCMANRAIAIIKEIKNVNPYYLFSYLSSKYGMQNFEQIKMGGVQQRMNLQDISQLKIPILSNSFQLEIEKMVKEAHKLLEESKTAYKEAEELLLNEVFGTDREERKYPNYYVKMLSETQKAERLDAEYFQPKYEVLLNKIKSYKGGWCELGEVIESYNYGFAFKSEDYQKEGLPLIRINNIKKDKLDLENVAYLSSKFLNECNNCIAKAGDILLSMSGTIGNCAVIPNDTQQCLINQRVMSFSVLKIFPEVLSLLLNGKIGEMQFEQIGVGGLQVNLSANDIKSIKIPILPHLLQSQLLNLIKSSFTNRKRSKELLELAKLGVEKAIEESEEVAINFIVISN